MLTQLSSVKLRLGIVETDPQYDVLLTNAIQAVSARFDQACNRTLARTENFTQEFGAEAGEIPLACYPFESLGRFELKSTEAEGWVEQMPIEYLVRSRCVISLAAPLGTAGEQGRILYTGGYVLPGTAAGPGQAALPVELEQAAIEQVAFWFQTRDALGVVREWPKAGTYRQFADLDLLPAVRAVLKAYERWRI